MVSADVSDNWGGFSGFVYIFPRGGSPGSGGTNSMKLAGTVQTPSVQIATGTVMNKQITATGRVASTATEQEPPVMPRSLTQTAT